MTTAVNAETRTTQASAHGAAPASEPVEKSTTLSVAPMMAWTDRHCRYLHRLCAPQAKLFTEMITAGALLHGPREALLAADPSEHPVGIQLGGCDPPEMAIAAKIAEAAGFDEINLNVGCPSPRVQRGSFGVCLMRQPGLVADIVSAMRGSVDIPVTVKCRLGIDADDSTDFLETFIGTVANAGCQQFYVHARKALLNGISPAQNRAIPPLQPQRVYALKAKFPELRIWLNGGINEPVPAIAHLQYVDGIMIGRQAYQRPLFLNELAIELDGTTRLTPWNVMADYSVYMERELSKGTRLQDMTRHCLGLFSGLKGARAFRRTLSDSKNLKKNDPALLQCALAELSQAA